MVVATLNTRGIPPIGSHLPERYEAIAEAFESSDVDIVAFQEVFTWYHLQSLRRHMPSFRHIGYRRSVAGPAGGLVTASRRPIATTSYRRFSRASNTSDLPWRTRVTTRLRGTLLTTLGAPQLTVINTHPSANVDGDWSVSNRFHGLHRQQLDALAGIVRSAPGPSVVCGDFNVARDSALVDGLMADSLLRDVFDDDHQPTFHAEYLPSGRTAHCIDFILVTDPLEVEGRDVLFRDKVPLPGGPAYVSDHVGLRASLVLSGAGQ